MYIWDTGQAEGGMEPGSDSPGFPLIRFCCANVVQLLGIFFNFAQPKILPDAYHKNL